MDADGLLTLPDGRHVQTWEGGDPRGTPVLFFHGCPDTRHAAMPGHDAARSAGIRLVAFNRPGYGWSDAAASTHASVADDAAAVADELRLQQVAAVGMSIGGQYALAFAGRHPDRVHAVAALATPAVIPALDPPTHRDDLSAQAREELCRLAALPIGEAMETARPQFEDFVAQVAPDDADDEALTRRWLAMLPAADAALVRAISTVGQVAASVREALVQREGYLRDAALAFREWAVDPRTVRCPVRLWYGEDDDNVSLRSARWFAEHLPDARLVVRPGTGHLATLHRHWDEVLRTVTGER